MNGRCKPGTALLAKLAKTKHYACSLANWNYDFNDLLTEM
jgi:hypothetical protein